MPTTYTWVDEFKSTIKEVADDGTTRFIPTDPANTDYAKIVEKGLLDQIEPYVPPPSTPTIEEKT